MCTSDSMYILIASVKKELAAKRKKKMIVGFPKRKKRKKKEIENVSTDKISQRISTQER